MSEPDDKPMARIYLGDDRWHDGPGWYYVEDECEDEGSCGAFTTREECTTHAEAAGYAVEPELCSICQRRRHTDADLARWKAEVGDAVGPEPEWARRLCWTKREFTCQCQPLKISQAVAR